jgi:transcriptional regulator with XRE-family HTH domain
LRAAAAAGLLARSLFWPTQNTGAGEHADGFFAAQPSSVASERRIHHSDSLSINVDTSAAQIAGRLRLERQARGWTLADLAARSGVSRAMISKIERCEASPTATLLVRLASAFDLTLGSLIARAEGATQPLVRAADQPLWRDPASGYLRRQVFERMDHPIELVRVELPAGARIGLPAASYAHIRQVVWVLEGGLVIDEAGERRELSAGDCLGFGPPADTTIANESAETCAYLVIVARS